MLLFLVLAAIFFFLPVVLTIVGIFTADGTWTHRFAIAVDMFFGSLTEEIYGITISSWCGIQLRLGAKGNTFGKLLGTILNHIQTNHCEIAIAADLERCQGGAAFLQSVPPVK